MKTWYAELYNGEKMLVEAPTQREAWEKILNKCPIYMEDNETASEGPNWQTDFEAGGWIPLHFESRNLAALHEMIDIWKDEVDEFIIKRVYKEDKKNAVV